MTDHFAEAERLLADTARDDQSLPFVRAKIRRANIHAQLAIAQAIAMTGGAGFVDYDDSAEYARSRSGEFLPVRDVEPTGDRL